jgi:hypothetical protein
MNAGRNMKKAYAAAQDNADWTGEPRYVHMYNGVFWISKSPCEGSIEFLPRKKRGGGEFERASDIRPGDFRPGHEDGPAGAPPPEGL